MTTDSHLSSPGSSLGIRDFFRNSMAISPANTHARFGFALATSSGVTALENALAAEGLTHFEKRWIIGLQFGITEPSALRSLMDMARSEVRIHRPSQLTVASILASAPFHAKIVLLGRGLTDVSAVFAGSSNLTDAAIGPVPRNYEVALSSISVVPEMQSSLNRWWRDAWNRGTPANEEFLQQYADLRVRLLQRNPAVRAFAEDVTVGAATTAESLWIEAGAMSGGSRNQVEFSEGLVQFFGDLRRESRIIRIRRGTRVWEDRPLSYKVTTFGVEIWRLSLPTEFQGGFAYPGQVIRLEKENDASGEIWSLQVASPSGRPFRRWLRESAEMGTVGWTSGGRRYGLV